MRMDDLLKVIDAGETLTDVVPLEHVDLPGWFAAIRLHFSSSVLCVRVNPDNDSLEVSSSASPETTELPSLSEREPWRRVIGRPILCAWRLVDHQGYDDGIQLAFLEHHTGIASVVIQLVGAASALDVSTVCGSHADRPVPEGQLTR